MPHLRAQLYRAKVGIAFYNEESPIQALGNRSLPAENPNI